ncbi:MAG: alpha/beta hydrolase [Anaerolineae bacterium]|nr:alpha/beta hydrolase [Anaerolineae bacterium]
MRSLEPRRSGQFNIRGFRIGFKEFGQPDAPAVLLLPPWQIVHHRHWKMQIPYLSLFFRVIVFDAPGNGDSERTTDPAASQFDSILDDAIGVLDHLNVSRAHVIGFSRGAPYGVGLAARFPERVQRLILIAYGPPKYDGAQKFWTPRRRYQGMEKRNAHYWREHYDDWLDFFFKTMFVERHSTKQIDDGIEWGRATTPEVLAATLANPVLKSKEPLATMIDRITCPVLVIHGTADQLSPISHSQNLVKVRPDWELVVLEGSGHAPHLRDPVKINLLIKEFLCR